MMTRSELEDRIFQILFELTAIPPSDLSIDDDLQADINLDSVSSLEMLGMMDEDFGVQIELEEVRDVRTIRDIVDLAERHLNVA